MSHRLSVTATAVTIVVAGVSFAGCSESPTAPRSRWTVSGTVWIYGPAGAVRANSGKVFGWIEDGNPAFGGEAIGGTLIDTRGQYQLDVPVGIARVRLQGPLFQPCGVTIEPRGTTTADIQLVSDPHLLGASVPAELRNQGPTLSGTVYEQMSQGPQPLANVSVQLRHYSEDGFLIASTMTDADGRYALCRVPFLQGLTLVTFVEGFTTVEIFLGTAVRQTQDVEMRRR